MRICLKHSPDHHIGNESHIIRGIAEVGRAGRRRGSVAVDGVRGEGSGVRRNRGFVIADAHHLGVDLEVAVRSVRD